MSNNKIIFEVRPTDTLYSVFKIENGIKEEGDLAYTGDDGKGQFQTLEWVKGDEVTLLRIYQDKSFTFNHYDNINEAYGNKYGRRYRHNISVVFK